VDAFQVTALILFVGLSALVVYIVLRSKSAGQESRGSEAFREAVAAAGARSDATLAPVSELVDQVRRHHIEGGSILTDVAAAQAAVADRIAEVEAIPAPDGFQERRERIAEDLRRADRALDRIEHGCRLLHDTTSRVGDLEGQTSVKRGYLELQHARESAARHVLEASRPPSDVGRASPGGRS
jgi:hypothetical protein